MNRLALIGFILMQIDYLGNLKKFDVSHDRFCSRNTKSVHLLNRLDEPVHPYRLYFDADEPFGCNLFHFYAEQFFGNF